MVNSNGVQTGEPSIAHGRIKAIPHLGEQIGKKCPKAIGSFKNWQKWGEKSCDYFSDCNYDNMIQIFGNHST